MSDDMPYGLDYLLEYSGQTKYSIIICKFQYSDGIYQISGAAQFIYDQTHLLWAIRALNQSS